MSEAKPTPGPCYADGQVVHSDAVSYIAIFGEAVPRRGWSGSDYATNAHKDANAELFADALNVLTDTGLTPSQLVERVKELEEALTLADLLLSGANMNRANVELKVRAALSKARPNTAEGEAPSEADREDLEAVIACLGDDAATLREQNPECEMAANMDRAAELLAAAKEPSP
jgi:hypothetical protein